MIAPFWGDVDTSGPSGGVISFRQSASRNELDKAQRDIREAYSDASTFVPTLLFIVTWDHVGYFQFIQRADGKVMLEAVDD